MGSGICRYNAVLMHVHILYSYTERLQLIMASAMSGLVLCSTRSLKKKKKKDPSTSTSFVDLLFSGSLDCLNSFCLLAPPFISHFCCTHLPARENESALARFHFADAAIGDWVRVAGGLQRPRVNGCSTTVRRTPVPVTRDGRLDPVPPPHMLNLVRTAGFATGKA